MTYTWRYIVIDTCFIGTIVVHLVIYNQWWILAWPSRIPGCLARLHPETGSGGTGGTQAPGAQEGGEVVLMAMSSWDSSEKKKWGCLTNHKEMQVWKWQ